MEMQLVNSSLVIDMSLVIRHLVTRQLVND